MQSIVTFNIGGAFFSTNRDTLNNKEPASRLALISKGILSAVQDDAGVFFIDRDPKHFQLILNYMRDGWCSLPTSQLERQELLQEVRYYQLGAFEAWIRAQELLNPITSSPSSSPFKAQPVNAGVYATPGAIPAAAASVGMPFSSPMPPQPYVGTAFAHAVPAAALGSPQHPGGYAMPQPLSSPAAAPMGMGNSMVPQYPMHSVAPHLYTTTSYAPSAAVAYRPASAATPAASARAEPGNGSPSARQSLRDAFLKATSPAPHAQPVASFVMPASEDGAKWTSKYLRTNSGLRECVNTLLELGYMPHHRSLHTGKVHIRVSSACDHDRASSLVGGTQHHLRGKHQTVRATGAAGWSYEFTIPPDADLSLFEKYNLAEYVQDNWFVLCAVLKDVFGVLMEEDTAGRPSCPSCRRTHLSITLHKIL